MGLKPIHDGGWHLVVTNGGETVSCLDSVGDSPLFLVNSLVNSPGDSTVLF